MTTIRPSRAELPMRRILDAAGVAGLFGKSRAWFYGRRTQLEARGFPRRDQLMGGWDAEAVHRWIDRQSGSDHPTAVADDPWG
jgi:predicted DNA-binding transcriptional regulator AlpA